MDSITLVKWNPCFSTTYANYDSDNKMGDAILLSTIQFIDKPSQSRKDPCLSTLAWGLLTFEQCLAVLPAWHNPCSCSAGRLFSETSSDEDRPSPYQIRKKKKVVVLHWRRLGRLWRSSVLQYSVMRTIQCFIYKS